MPRVSVILPTHNRAAVLPRAVDSVLAQTFRDFEVRIIDDGSVDGTAALRWDDPRVHVEHTENRGPGAARNLGARRSSGEWLAFIDSDDEWLPSKLEAQITALDRTRVSVDVVCSAGRWHIDHLNRTYRYPLRYQGVVRLFDDLLREATPLPFSSILVRRAAFDAAGGFDESLPCAEDRDLLVRLARESAFLALPAVLVIKHVTETHRSDALESKIAFEQIFLRRYAADLAARPHARAGVLMRLGGLYFRQGQWTPARGAFLRALRLQPTHLPAYGYLGATLWLQVVTAGSRRSRWFRWVRLAGWRGQMTGRTPRRQPGSPEHPGRPQDRGPAA